MPPHPSPFTTYRMAAHFQTPPTQAACASGDDGINVLGIPLGSSDFVESYLFGKGIKHRQLLSFITEVATTGSPREAVAMLNGVVCPRLSHLLKSIEKNANTEMFTQEIDTAHVSTWLHCLFSSPDLEHSLNPNELNGLTDWLDLPPSYGGSGLNSLYLSLSRRGTTRLVRWNCCFSHLFLQENRSTSVHQHRPSTKAFG